MYKNKPGNLYYKLKSILLFTMLTLVAFLNFALIPELQATQNSTDGSFTVEDFATFDTACSENAIENNETYGSYNCKILGFEETNSNNFKYSKTSDLFLGSEISLWNKGNPILTGNALYYLTGNSNYLNSTNQEYLYTENDNDYYSLYKVFKFTPNWVYTGNYKYTLKSDDISYETFYNNENEIDSLYKYQETDKGNVEYSIYFDILNLQNQYSFTSNDYSGFENIDPTVSTNQTYETKVTSISNLFSYNYNLYTYMITHETKDINGNIVTETGNTTPYYDSTNKLYYIYNEENEWFDVYTFDSTVASKWADSSEEIILSNFNYYPLNQSTEKYIKTNVRAYYNWDEYEYNVTSSETVSQIKGQTSKPADVSGSNTYTYYDNEETDYFKIDYTWSWDYIVPVWESGLYFTTDWYENETTARNNESLSEEDYNLTISSSKTQGTYESIDTYNVVKSVKTGATSSINKKIDNILYELSGTQYEFKKITTANVYGIDESSKQTYTSAKSITAASQSCSYGIANGYQYTSTKCIFSKEDTGYRDYAVSRWESSYYFQQETGIDKSYSFSKYTLDSTVYETLPLGSTTSTTQIEASKDPNSDYYYVEKKEQGIKYYEYKTTYGWNLIESGSKTIDLETQEEPNSIDKSGNSATLYTESGLTYENGYYPYVMVASSNFASQVPYSSYTSTPTLNNLPSFYTTKSTVTGYSASYSRYVNVTAVTVEYRLNKKSNKVTIETFYAPTRFLNLDALNSLVNCFLNNGGTHNGTLIVEDPNEDYEEMTYSVLNAMKQVQWYTDSTLTTKLTANPTVFSYPYSGSYGYLTLKSVSSAGYLADTTKSFSGGNMYYYSAGDYELIASGNANLSTEYYSTSTLARAAIPSDEDYTYIFNNRYLYQNFYSYKVYQLKNQITTGTSSSQGSNNVFSLTSNEYRLYYSKLIEKTYNYKKYSWGTQTSETNISKYKTTLNGTIITNLTTSTILSTSTSNYSTASDNFDINEKKYYYAWRGTRVYLYSYEGYSKKDGGKYVNTGNTRKELYSGCGLSCTSGSYKYDYIDNTTYYNWVVANTKQTGVHEYTNSEKPYTYSYFSSTPSNTTPSGNGLGSKYVTTGNIKYLYNIYERQVTNTKKLYRYDSTWRDYTNSRSGWVSLGNSNYKGYTQSGSVNSTLTTLNSCTGNEGYNSGICYVYTGTKENQRIGTRQLYKYDVHYNSEKVLKEVKVFSSTKTSASTDSNSSSTTLNYANYIPNASGQTRRICSTTNDYNCYKLTGTNRSYTEYFKYNKHIITYNTTAQKTSEINGLENGYYDSGYVYKDVETINNKNANGTPQTKNLLNNFDWFQNATTYNVVKYYKGTQIVLQNTTNFYTHVNYSGQNKITLKPNTKYTFTVNGYKDSNTYGKIGIILPNKTLDNTPYYAGLSETNGTKEITFTTDSTGQIAIGYYVTCPNQNGKIYINWMQIEEGNSFTSYSTYKTYTKQNTRTNTYYQYFHYTPTYNYYLDNENMDFDYEITTKIVKYTLSNGTIVENNENNDDFEHNFVKNYINNNVKLNSIMIGYDFNKNGKYDSNEYWYYRNTPSQWVSANTDSNGVVTQKYKLSTNKYKFYYSTSRNVILDVSTTGNYFTKDDYTSKVESEGDIIVNFNDITQNMINNMSTTGNSSSKVLYKNSYYPEDSEIARYSLLLDYMKFNGLITTDYQIVYNASKHDFYYYDQYLKVYYQHKICLDDNKDAQGYKLDKGYSVEITSKNELKNSLNETNYFEIRNKQYYNGYVVSLESSDVDSMNEYINKNSDKYGLLLYASIIDFAKTKYVVSNGNSYKLVSQNLNYNAYVEFKNGGYWETFAGTDFESIGNFSELFSYNNFIDESTSLYIFIYEENNVEKYIPIWAENSSDAITKATVSVTDVNVEFSLNNSVILSASEVLEQLKLTKGNKIKITNLDEKEVYVEIDSYFLLNGTSEYTYVLTKKSSEFSFTNYMTLENLGHLYMDDNALGSSWYIYKNNLNKQENDFTKTFEHSLQYSLTRINDVETGGYAVHFDGMHNYWKVEDSYTINGGRFNVGSELNDRWLNDSSSALSEAIEKNATISSSLFTGKLSYNSVEIPEVITVNTGSRDVTFYNDPLEQNTINLHSNVNAYDTYSLYAINYKGKTIYYEDYIDGLAKVLTILYKKFASNQKDNSYFFINTSVSGEKQNLEYWKRLGLSEEEYYMYAPILIDTSIRKTLMTSSYLNLVFDGNEVYTYNASDENMQSIMKNAFTSNEHTDSSGNKKTIFVYDELYYKGAAISPYLSSPDNGNDEGLTNARITYTDNGYKNISAGILGDSYIPYYATLENTIVTRENTSMIDYNDRYLGTAQLPIPLSNNNELNCKNITYSQNFKEKIKEALSTENMLQAIKKSWEKAEKNLLYVNSGVEGLSLVYRKLSNTDMIRDQFTNTVVWGTKYNNGAVFGNLMLATYYDGIAYTIMEKRDYVYFGSKGFVATLNDYVPQNYYLDNNDNKMKAIELEFSSNNFNTGYTNNNDNMILMVNDILGTSGIDVERSVYGGINSLIKATPKNTNGFKLWGDSFFYYPNLSNLFEKMNFNKTLDEIKDLSVHEYIFNYSINSNFYFFTFYGLNFDLERMNDAESESKKGKYNVLPSEFAKSANSKFWIISKPYLKGIFASEGLVKTNDNNNIKLPKILDYITNNFEGEEKFEDFITNNYLSKDQGVFYPKDDNVNKTKVFDKLIYGFVIYNDELKNSMLTNLNVAALKNHEVDSFSKSHSFADNSALDEKYSLFFATGDNNYADRFYRRVTLVTGSRTKLTKTIDLYIDFGNDKIKSESTYTSFDIDVQSNDTNGIKGINNFTININLLTKDNNYGISDEIIKISGASLLNAFQNYEVKIYYIPKTNENCSTGYIKSEGRCYLINLQNDNSNSKLKFISYNPYTYKVRFVTYVDEWIYYEDGTSEFIENNSIIETVTIISSSPIESDNLNKIALNKLKNQIKYSDYQNCQWTLDKIETIKSTYDVNQGYWNIIDINKTDNSTITLEGTKHNLLPETEYYIATRIRFVDGSVSGVTYAEYKNNSKAVSGNALTSLKDYETPSVILGYDMVNNPYGTIESNTLLKSCGTDGTSVCSGDELLNKDLIPSWLNEAIFSVPSNYSEFLNNSFDDNFKNIMNNGYTPGFEKFKVYTSNYVYNNLLTKEEKEEYFEEKNSKGEIIGYYKLYPVSNQYRLHLTKISVIGVQFKLLEVDSKTENLKEITNLTGQFSFIKGDNPSLTNSNNTASTIDGKIVYSLSENDFIAKSNYNNELTFVNDYLLNYNIFNIYVNNSNLDKSDKIYKIIYSNQYGDMYSYIDYNMDNNLSGNPIGDNCYDAFGYKVTEEKYHEKYLNSFFDSQWRYEYNSDGTISERKFITLNRKDVYLGHVRGGKVDTIIIG